MDCIILGYYPGTDQRYASRGIEHEPSTTSVQDPEIAEVVLNHISDKPSTEWTPSYSVTVQQPGTSTQPKVETVEESATPEIHVADIDVPTQAADIQGSAEHPPSRTWTPSYSVHTLSKTQEMASAEQTSSNPVIVAPTPRAPPVQIEGLDGHSNPLASSVSATVERPWTPSYSVSTLGNPAPAIVEPSDVAPEASSSNTVSEAPTRPWTPSYSVSQQGKPAPVEIVDSAATEPPRSTSPYPQSYSVTNQRGTQKPAQELEEAKQPPRSWTPSYSVSTQGIPAPVQMPEVQIEGTPVNVAEVKQIGPFPQSYSVTNQPGSPRVQPVDTVDEVPVTSVNLGWTPSYSVSRQGSPAPPVPALVAEPEPAAVVEPVRSVTDQQASPRIEVTNPVNPAGLENTPKRSWTRSYSVHSQGSVVDLPSHVAAVSESSDDSPADPSTPVTGLDNLPDPEVGQRYWPAWFSASKTDLHEEPMDAPSAEPDPVKPSFDTEEVNADGKGCVIM
ncbi:hypothetical protein DL96DRAFT_15385 [Flagelloscypha sp. PMI_526]|nr:hypothetical protein DL96DRAFT_15385 [Flagelloscypha sp. PMI_526]